MRSKIFGREKGMRRESNIKVERLENLESRVLLSTTTALGVNIEPVTDWARSFMFVDAMKSSRAFGSASVPWDGKATLDANGWPTGDFGAAVITVNSPTLAVQDYPSISGTYHLTAQGKATITGVASPISVTNQFYDSASNTTTADVNVAPGATNLYLSFTNTQGFKDVKLIRPGYAADTTQEFTNDFVASLAPFQTLRLMDYLDTNGNVSVNWSDRAKVTDATQTGNRGAAWEYAIDLANQTHKDLWINVPAHASDDYVTQLATLLKNNLDSNLNVYLEYSNEVWNQGFEQGVWNAQQALSDEAANPSVLNYDGSNNINTWAWRRVVVKLEHVESIFAGVYGQSAIDTTVRPVLASQVAYGYVLRDQLNFLEHFYGKPGDTLYAVAGAPYIDIGSLSSSPSLTTDQVISALQASVGGVNSMVQKYTALAKYYGLHTLMYEGGLALQGDVNGNFVGAKLPATYDSRIGTVMTDYLNSMYADGVEQLMYFEGTGAYGPYGAWGLTENVSNLTGPKYAAVTAFANTTPPTVAAGVPLPASMGEMAVIDAGTYTADQWQTAGTGGGLGFSAVGNTFDYLLNSKGASYALTISAGSWGGTGKMEVLLDNQLVATLSAPATGAISTYAAMQTLNLMPGNVAGLLTAGLHTLRLVTVESGFGVGSLAIQAVSAGSTGLLAKALSPNSIELSWVNETTEKGYFVERSMDGMTGWTQVGNTAVPGDANGDGAVDFKDFVILSNNFGMAGGWAQGNFTGSPTVDFASFVVLSNNFGKVFDPLRLGYSVFDDTGLVAGTTYYYRIRALTTAGVTPYLGMTATQTLTVVAPVAVAVPATTPLAAISPTSTNTTPVPTRTSKPKLQSGDRDSTKSRVATPMRARRRNNGRIGHLPKMGRKPTPSDDVFGRLAGLKACNHNERDL